MTAAVKASAMGTPSIADGVSWRAKTGRCLFQSHSEIRPKWTGSSAPS